MTFLQMAAVLLAGMAAGTINVVVGSGTLITFPTLLAFGVPPVTANVSNTIGLVPGVASGVFGYRRELKGQRRRAIRLGSASLLGGVVGALLLLVLPEGAFKAIVPALIVLGLLLVVLQPRISAWVDARHEGARGEFGPWWVWPAVFATGVYGGYFGAAQGVILMGVLGIGIADTLQRLNGVKNVLAGLVNGIAGLIFIFVADVDWTVVLLIAAGSVVGGQLGATVGRRLSPIVLRVVIVVVGLAALASFLLK
ncbi:MAG TPA: sulfite exporter TauE/SafE family protein [Nocardioides sp.]|nr:sulfite exporter TauE/SafE family protein [Nocardioides sp.]